MDGVTKQYVAEQAVMKGQAKNPMQFIRSRAGEPQFAGMAPSSGQNILNEHVRAYIARVPLAFRFRVLSAAHLPNISAPTSPCH